MQTFEKYLQVQGFTKVDNIEFLKISADDKYDLRYFFDNNRLGLHINGATQFIDTQEVFEDKNIGEYLEVLYISNTLLKEVIVDDKKFPKLKYVNLSLNKALNRIIFENLSSLEELNTYHCPELQVFHLDGKFPSLKKLDISFLVKIDCQILHF